MKGFRTIFLNAALAAGTAILGNFTSVDWVAMVGPTWAMLIVAAVNVAMRLITTGPVGTKE